jgi:DNA-binding HxlR family transcriptional regulator
MRRLRMRCSLARALGSIGEFWTLLVVRNLWSYGPQRFDDLQNALGISSNTLTNRLTRLTEQGVVERRLYQAAPERYEYCLTPAGMDLLPALMVLTAWGDRHLADAAGPPTVFRHRAADHVAQPIVACGTCGEPLSVANTHPDHGPGAPPDARPYLDAAATVSAHRPA